MSSYQEILADGHSLQFGSYTFPSTENPDHDLHLARICKQLGTLVPLETCTYILNQGGSLEAEGFTFPHRGHPDHDKLVAELYIAFKNHVQKEENIMTFQEFNLTTDRMVDAAIDGWRFFSFRGETLRLPTMQGHGTMTQKIDQLRQQCRFTLRQHFPVNQPFFPL